MAEILHQLRLVVYPIIYKVLYKLYIPGGAGFQPSTVCWPALNPSLAQKINIFSSLIFPLGFDYNKSLISTCINNNMLGGDPEC